ncbi:MAG TPA: CoA transferase [Candidatus Binataceae bacterium]|nr:CoA transferase [Candidatus Binataceae bacterium]
MDQNPQALPLTGFRVVEYGLFHAGPTCAAMLGALGAEVIKVENPKKGDPVRNLVRLYGQDSRLLSGRSIPFETYNAGKKSITFDLNDPEGRRLLHALVAKADIFVHNVKATTAVAMTIDFDSLIMDNPRLVYASVSGFGPRGPEATRPGLDPVGLARSGLMSVLSGGSHKPPILPPTGMADHMAGIMTAYGVLGAIIARNQTGRPQRVESSLLGGAMWLGQLNLQYALFSGRELLPLDHSSDPLLNSYQCKDGRWIFIAAPSERAWPALCNGLGLPELVSDPRFINFEQRWTNRAELLRLLEGRFASRDASAWEPLLAAQSGLVFEIVRRPTEIHEDPQSSANGYISDVEHPERGPSKRVGFPIHINGEQPPTPAAAPILGQHTEEVLTDLLGLSWEEVSSLRERGTI